MDGTDFDCARSAYVEAAPEQSQVPVFAQKPENYDSKSSLGDGHYLHSDAARFRPAQYTSNEFIGTLEHRPLRISMIGQGRAFDNVMVERLWRTVKYEEVYLKDVLNPIFQPRLHLENHMRRDLELRREIVDRLVPRIAANATCARNVAEYTFLFRLMNRLSSLVGYSNISNAKCLPNPSTIHLSSFPGPAQFHHF